MSGTEKKVTGARLLIELMEEAGIEVCLSKVQFIWRKDTQEQPAKLEFA